MRNKRGLSDIVATVLIILLAISAVVLVGYFVNKLIQRISAQGELSTLCFENEVAVNTCTNSTNTQAQVVVELKKGNIADMSNIIAVVQFTDGETSRADLPPGNINVGETETVNVDITGKIPSKAYAIVEVKREDTTRLCQESVKIDCT